MGINIGDEAQKKEIEKNKPRVLGAGQPDPVWGIDRPNMITRPKSKSVQRKKKP